MFISTPEGHYFDCAEKPDADELFLVSRGPFTVRVLGNRATAFKVAIEYLEDWNYFDHDTYAPPLDLEVVDIHPEDNIHRGLGNKNNAELVSITEPGSHPEFNHQRIGREHEQIEGQQQFFNH